MSSRYTAPLIRESDKFCERSCSLELGISEYFNEKLKELQLANALNSKKTVRIFDTSKEQAMFQSILNDPIMRALDHPVDQQIFRAALEGMERNQPEILRGQQNNIFMCPTAFSYDSRVYESSVPEVLENWQEELEAKQNLSSQDKLNLSKIRSYLRRIRPQITEQEFFDAFATFFYQRRGIFIHSLKMDSYLKVFIDKAESERNINNSMCTKLSSLEKRICNALNISTNDLNDASDKVLNRIQETLHFRAWSETTGRKIRDAIDEKLHGDLVEKTKRKFKPGRNYNQSEIIRALRLAQFETICKFSGENDMFILLPDLKLILCIEVKRHMKKDDSDATQNHIDRNLKSASAQLKKNADYTAKIHGTIFSPGWQLVKIAALSPRVYSPQKICSSCNPFIITTDMLKEPGGMLRWWHGTGLERIGELDSRTKQKSYKEFLMFYNRIVNLSKVRVLPDVFKSWEQIQGDNLRHMAAGYTEAFKSSTPGYKDVEDILQRPHDAYKVIAFNDDQESLLFEDIQFALFLNDFGAGEFKIIV